MDINLTIHLRLLLLLLISFFLLMFIVVVKIKKKARMAKQLQIRRQIGRMGEEDTIRQLERVRGHKRILCNLYVPLQDGANTTEIDAVMIHEKGIFVIENKNYSGRIYGKEEENWWLQIQKQGRKRWTKHFYSPVRQNQAHIRHLKRFLLSEVSQGPEGRQKALQEISCMELPYISVITFNDRARLKRISVWSDDILVSESRKVRRRLRRRMRRMSRALTRKQVEQLSETLRVLENPGKRVRRQHGRYLNQVG